MFRAAVELGEHLPRETVQQMQPGVNYRRENIETQRFVQPLNVLVEQWGFFYVSSLVYCSQYLFCSNT